MRLEVGVIKHLDYSAEERTVHRYGADISVFSDGSVWIHRGSRNFRRFGNTNRKGYKYVLVWEHGHEHTLYVHRLVASAFVPNPGNKPCINHKNGDCSDNRPENLEWCTNEENLRHRYDTLKHYGRRTAVLCVESGVLYESTLAASNATGINRANIWRSTKNPNWSAGGFHWKVVSA